MKEEVYKYYANRFIAQNNWGVNLDRVQFSTISEANNDMLCNVFKEGEILVALRECGGSKSPWLNGFNFNFIKSNWEILGDDIIKVLKWFHVTGFILRGCNTSFVTLIPKCNNPSKLGDFRPISSVGCVYKLLTKILANRLKRVFGKVIDRNQSTFLSDRVLLDSVLIANEMVDFLRNDRMKGVIVKVDFEKAYGSVEWKFLEYMMKRLGFQCRWIN